MAKFGSDKIAFVLVDGFNIVGVETMLQDGLEAVTEETTGLGSTHTWQAHTPTGLRKATLSQDGFYDDASDSVNAALSGNQQTSRVVCHGFEGNTIGEKFRGAEGAFGSKYNRIASRGGLHKANAEYTVSGQVDDGIILQNLAAKTATFNTEGADSQDNTTSSAAGGVGFLQVTLISGTGATLDAKVRHSADDVTYADLITFAQVVLADTRKAERKTVAGTVNRHVAVSATIAGTTPSFTLMVGFARG